jgi:4'-phosphopantetheinyl transferase
MCKDLIYLAKLDFLLPENTFEYLLQFISEENQRKCKGFRFREDALRTLYGELILRYVLQQRFSYKHEEIVILKGEKGKPYLKDIPIHFNISHGGEYVVCGFSQEEVGVDIEEIKDIDLNVAKRFFSKKEYENLLSKKPENQRDYFLSLWTLKESYLKWLGDGMAIPLDSFCFEIDHEDITLEDDNRDVIPFFKEYFVDGYKLAVCVTTDKLPEEILEISIGEILEYLELIT